MHSPEAAMSLENIPKLLDMNFFHMRIIFTIIRGKKINNRKKQILLGYSFIIFVSVM